MRVGEEWDFILLVLRTLEREGPMNQTRLAELTGSNKNKISRYVEALAKRGLVDKKLDPGPPRQTQIVLSDKGRCVISCLKERV